MIKTIAKVVGIGSLVYLGIGIASTIWLSINDDWVKDSGAYRQLDWGYPGKDDEENKEGKKDAR